LNYWLYPEPYRPETEESLFLARESDRVLAIDGKRLDSKCWGWSMDAQAYRRKELICRIHILPGRHTVDFEGSMAAREMMRLDFSTQAGKAYGLQKSGCRTTFTGDQQTCRVEVVEIDQRAGG
jgi:hypothetical protein